MGVNVSKDIISEELMNDDNNNGSKTKNPQDELNGNISKEEDTNLDISNKSITSENNDNSQAILVPEDVDQLFFTDSQMYSYVDASETSTSARVKHSRNFECMRTTLEPQNSLDALELSTMESASVDIDESLPFDILDEDFELRDPMEQKLLKRKVSPGRKSYEPLLKKQKVADDVTVDEEIDAERKRMIEMKRKKMMALKEHLREENKRKWMGSYKNAILEEYGEEEEECAPWMERKPREPSRYFTILLQALEAQAERRSENKAVEPEKLAVEEGEIEVEGDNEYSDVSDEEQDDDVRQKQKKKASKGRTHGRNFVPDLRGDTGISFSSASDDDLLKLNAEVLTPDTWETGTFSSATLTDSEGAESRANFLRKLRDNSMSFLDTPYLLPSDVSREMQVDEDVDDKSRSTSRSDVDIFADEEEESERGADAESMAIDVIVVDEDREDGKNGGEVEEAVDDDEEGGNTADKPEEDGAPVDEDEEEEKAADEPEEGGAPVDEHEEGEKAADKSEEGGEAAVGVGAESTETDLLLNKQNNTESVIILESQEVIDVPSSSDDESLIVEAPVLPEDEVNVIDFLETSLMEEGEELNKLPPEVLVNPFFNKKHREKRNAKLATANTSISTFQLSDAFDMKYLEITITPMASNDAENPQISESIKIRAENSNYPKISKKETKTLRTPMKVKKSRDKKLMGKNKINDRRKRHNVARKEIVEIDLVDSDD